MAKQGTPEWWRDRLVAKLIERARSVKRFEDYYNGDHPLPEPPKNMPPEVIGAARLQYDQLQRQGRTNWVKLVADAPADRLAVVGFRFGEEPRGDTDAWTIWQRNQLDADSKLVHNTALQTGQAFVLVDPWPTQGRPVITCEHPSEMIVAYAPGSRRRRVAALKRWVDDRTTYVVLYLSDEIYKWTQRGSGGFGRWQRWQPPTDDGWPIDNPLGVVTAVEFRANPSLRPAPFGGGRSEFDGVLDIQDRINKTIFDRMVTAEFQAFRQRVITGWTPEDNPDDPDPEATKLNASASRAWFFGDKDVKVSELGQADFTQFVSSVESDVMAMAAITRTPPHYLLGKMVNIAADALAAAESGLTNKAESHADGFGESWEEVVSLALASIKDPRSADQTTMVIWRDFERRTLGQTVDAAVKMRTLGVPVEVCWSMLPGVTPTDIARWKALAEAEARREPAADVATT